MTLGPTVGQQHPVGHLGHAGQADDQGEERHAGLYRAEAERPLQVVGQEEKDPEDADAGEEHGQE